MSKDASSKVQRDPDGRLRHLITLEGLHPPASGARVKFDTGLPVVIDGPFTEAKEVIGGFALLQAKSKTEAIELTKRFLKVAGDGECELRQVFDAADFA